MATVTATRPMKTFAVPTATPQIVVLGTKGAKVGINAKPGGGGTVSVHTTMSPDPKTGATWVATAIAASAVEASLILDNVYTAVKFTAATAAAPECSVIEGGS